MANGEPRHVLRPSLLQRLLRRSTTTQRPAYELHLGAAELRQEVREHLEEILNSRVLADADELRQRPETARSLLAYGLPDLSRFARARRADLAEIRQLIRDAVIAFEPRLDPRSVVVELEDDLGEAAAGARRGDANGAFSVRLRIRATLDVEPVLEEVRFDTSIEVATGTVAVEEVD